MTTDERFWSDTRTNAIAAFDGQTPRAEDEEAILAVWMRQPAMVERVMRDVAIKLDRGEVRWAWSVVRSRVERGAESLDGKTDGSGEAAQAVANAERFMRAAGFHLPSESEVEAELFGRGGMLHKYADDFAIHQRMLDLWRELQPVYEAMERERAEQKRLRQEAERFAARARKIGNPLLAPDDGDPW